MLMGSYDGLDIQKVIYKGKELSDTKSYLDLNTKDMRGNEYEAIFGKSDYYEAFPGHLDFPQGKGFGILFKNRDFRSRPGFSSMWTVVPEYEKNLVEYLNTHPEVLLNIFKKNFIRDSNGNTLHSNDKSQSGQSVNNISLVSKNFMDINEKFKVK
jgi:hypothetical protein